MCECSEVEAASILDNKVCNSASVFGKGETERVLVIGRKCSCGSVWCSQCYVKKGGSQRFASRLQKMQWDRVREVVLTVDPKKYPDPETAFKKIQRGGKLSQFVRDLRRWDNITVVRYAWVLEWHTKKHAGYPHWHLFIETDKTGKAAQIGNQKLLTRWPHGLIWENYIRNEQHWKALTGYFAKRGYFASEKKQKQMQLPEWALDVNYKIRKTGGTELIKAEKPCIEEDQKEKKTESEKLPNNRTYRQILDRCGKYTNIEIHRGSNHVQYGYLKIAYKDFKNLPGAQYVEGIGIRITITKPQLDCLIETGKLT